MTLSQTLTDLKSILFLTFLLEALGAFVLYFEFTKAGSPQPVLDALFHSVSAFCNAGFSTFDDSLFGYRSNYAVLSVVMFLVVSEESVFCS